MQLSFGTPSVYHGADGAPFNHGSDQLVAYESSERLTSSESSSVARRSMQLANYG